VQKITFDQWCEKGKRSSHVDIWGGEFQVEVTADANALRQELLW